MNYQRLFLAVLFALSSSTYASDQKDEIFNLVPGLSSESAHYPYIPGVDVLTDPHAADLVESNSEAAGYTEAEAVSKISAGRSTALTYISQARQNPKMSADVLTILGQLSTKLSATPIVYPTPGQDFKGCDEGTLAFVIPSKSNRMFICAYVLNTEFSEAKPFAQIMSHETAHLIGYHNECDATLIELLVMFGSGEGTAFRNGYVSKCGFDKYFE